MLRRVAASAFAGGTWTIRGGGTAGMLNPPWGKWAWRGDDSCHFAYRKVTGDATLIARVTSIEEVQNFTMAGLMIRDSLQPKAARMAVWSTPNARGKGPSVETDLRGFSHSSHDSSFQIPRERGHPLLAETGARGRPHHLLALARWRQLDSHRGRAVSGHGQDRVTWACLYVPP